MNKEETAYRNKIAELHSEIEGKAKELQAVSELLDAAKGQKLELTNQKATLAKTIKEKEEIFDSLVKEIAIVEDRVKNKIGPKEMKILSLEQSFDDSIVTLGSLMVTVNSSFIALQSRMKGNKDLAEQYDKLINEFSGLKNKIVSLQDDCVKERTRVENLKKESIEIIQGIKDEFSNVLRQTDGINEKINRVRFYARRLAKAGGKDLLGELNDLGPFKFFPSRKLQVKLDKLEQKTK